jgi:uncharacterized membrane protein YfcA
MPVQPEAWYVPLLRFFAQISTVEVAGYEVLVTGQAVVLLAASLSFLYCLSRRRYLGATSMICLAGFTASVLAQTALEQFPPARVRDLLFLGFALLQALLAAMPRKKLTLEQLRKQIARFTGTGEQRA